MFFQKNMGEPYGDQLDFEVYYLKDDTPCSGKCAFHVLDQYLSTNNTVQSVVAFLIHDTMGTS